MSGKRGQYQGYTAERKERIVELFFRAMAAGWTSRRFCRVSKAVRLSTLHTWLTEDAYFERYRRAMQQKALSLPDRADDVIDRLINPKRDMAERLDSKTAGVVLRHMEFRLMREFKGGLYQPTQKINVADVTEMTDEQLAERAEELVRRGREGIDSE